MKWTRGGSGKYVEDRRGQGGGGGPGLGGVVGGLPIGKMGIGGVVLLIVIALIGGPNILGGGGGGGGGGGAPAPGVQGQPPDPATDPDREIVEFVKFVVNDLQETWQQKLGDRFDPSTLVLFTGSTPTACGYGQSAMGPFYCPPDGKMYIDLSFFRELDRRFGAPGDFAQAYVLAHEMGHHVQKLLGVEAEVRRAQAQRPDEANQLQVRMELMADCFAGVWGHSTRQRQLLEAGDLEEGLRAAAAIGDDRLQQQSGGRVAPESWTHGSSEMRARWLRRGLESGDHKQCDTFAARDL
jgi:predicted metalloprotease